MDRLKVTKVRTVRGPFTLYANSPNQVDGVLLQREQHCRRGTLHLTQHHLIFVEDNRDDKTTSHFNGNPMWQHGGKEGELWVSANVSPVHSDPHTLHRSATLFYGW